MDKGYYEGTSCMCPLRLIVAIHNKNGQGLLLNSKDLVVKVTLTSQSTIKMEKGYYTIVNGEKVGGKDMSQSTIKMEKGYYIMDN